MWRKFRERRFVKQKDTSAESKEILEAGRGGGKKAREESFREVGWPYFVATRWRTNQAVEQEVEQKRERERERERRNQLEDW